MNSINDTVESEQVARIVQSEFYMIADEFDIKHHDTLRKLEATDASTPTLMTRPEGFHGIEWIKYSQLTTFLGDQNYQTVCYMEPLKFLEYVSGRTVSDTNVEEMTLPDSTHIIPIRNDKNPQYWTILEGYDTIVFDSYDNTLDANLQQSKSLARGTQHPTLTIADASVPDLPESQMVLLRNRSRAMYFDLFKDGVTKEIDKRQRNSEVRAQRKKYITRKIQERRTGLDYGRK